MTASGKSETPFAKVMQGDCRERMKEIDTASVDLIVTSPPYGNQRARTYGGVRPGEYVEWFLPIAQEMLRVLSPSGAFILNIKEAAVNGERHTYVLELILGMIETGWAWNQEFIWHKTNCYPGRWPNRFRDAWERVLQFNHPQAGFKIHHQEEPTSTVLTGATECSNRGHSAAFPRWLPTAMIRKFTDPGDLVLDPFAGSGTTALAALDLGRQTIAIEMDPQQCGELEKSVRQHTAQLHLL